MVWGNNLDCRGSNKRRFEDLIAEEDVLERGIIVPYAQMRRGAEENIPSLLTIPIAAWSQ
jgi:hypothetical protein